MCVPWLEGIEGEGARRLIESDVPVIRVVAGPGAGKTFCLKRRTRRLIEGVGIDPASIFIGTFTRAIARELDRELGTDIHVSTLHSYAYKLLRENSAACLGMKLRFLLEYEEDSMLYDVASSCPHIIDQNHRRRELRRLQAAREERGSLPDARFAGSIHTWLVHHGGMLIGEVVHLAVQGLECEDIPRGQFDHVIVDEYQDLTASEQVLVEQIWSGNGSLVVLGDNDQSIYSFRYNHPSGIDEFSDRWRERGLCDIGIPENRRCGEQIVNIANLIMAELGSHKPPMIAGSGRPGEVALVQWENIDDEVNGLAAYIGARQGESFLVLVPRRFIGYRLKEAIGDEAYTAFHQEVLESQVAQERFATAAILANPDDLVAVRAWLGLHGSEPLQAERRNSEAYSSLPVGLRGSVLLRQIASGEIRPRGHGSNHIRARAQLLMVWLEYQEGHTLNELINEVFDSSIVATTTDDPEKRRWFANDISTICNASLSLLEEGKDSLGEIMGILRYRIATRLPLNPTEEDPRVRIMTLHSAKGLEADNIILAGVADQMIPGVAEHPSEQAEQARLLYVAATRARSKLIVSWCRRIRYADARPNNIRIDSVQTIEDEPIVVLGKSRFLPQALTGIKRGNQWLADERV